MSMETNNRSRWLGGVNTSMTKYHKFNLQDLIDDEEVFGEDLHEYDDEMTDMIGSLSDQIHVTAWER